VTWNVIRGYGS